jgi:hypothetical protein
MWERTGKKQNNEKLQQFHSSLNTVSLEWSSQRRLNELGRTEVPKESQTANASTQRYIPFQDQIQVSHFSKCGVLFNSY